MSTLLLRLAGPMQSWGVQSRFVIRDTGLEPSKSGVIGLLCAALGRPREAAVDDLAALHMGVRVDREGVMQTDYHTVGGVHREGDKGYGVERMGERPKTYGVARFGGKGTSPVLSWRRYLADADFLVGLEGEEALLRQLDAALAQPVWPLYLGRKAFVPSQPVRLPDAPPLGPSLRLGESLREALQSYPWPEARPGEHTAPETLRVVFEDPTGESGETRMDVPVSFAPLDRRYLSRVVVTEQMRQPTDVSTSAHEGA